jgi:hypothetical protein
MSICKFSEFAAALHPSVSENSPIPFFSKVKKMDKLDEPDTDKSEWLKFLMDSDNPASKYFQQFAIFKD